MIAKTKRPQEAAMAKVQKIRSPRVYVNITPERWDTAVRASSGGCLIADAIKKDYPQFSKVEVDTAQIRASDPSTGFRYQWITPVAAAELLMAFDHGHALPQEHTFRLNGASRISPLVRHSDASKAEKRAERLAELEAKEDDGTLTAPEAAYLKKMRQPRPERPKNHGKTEVADTPGGRITVGRPLPQNRKNPNLLAGRNRVYGRRLSNPTEFFDQAVARRVAEEVARLAGEASGEVNPAEPDHGEE